MSRNQRKLKRQRYENIVNNRFDALNVGFFGEFENMPLDIKESLVGCLEHVQRNGNLDLETDEGLKRLSVLVEDHISMMELKNDG